MADRGENETRADVARRLGVSVEELARAAEDAGDTDWGWSEDDPELDPS
jgi:hypothetical protein